MNEALAFLRAGDSLTVWKLDRASRSIRDMIELSEELKRRDINLLSVTDHIDTRTPSGKFVFLVLAAIGQLEKDLIVERTLASLAAARTR